MSFLMIFKSFSTDAGFSASSAFCKSSRRTKSGLNVLCFNPLIELEIPFVAIIQPDEGNEPFSFVNLARTAWFAVF
jgi:hypothetical protein